MFCTRRGFLKTTFGASTILSFAPGLPSLLARAGMAVEPRRDDRDTVLVVVQLSGGNDGLNTVVPYEDDEYARNRPTLRLPSNTLHKINPLLGFHPQMGAFAELHKEGYLSIVQGVGYPNSDRSHEGAMRIWHTADADRPSRQTGWLGRTVDSIWSANETDTYAAFVGPITQPFGLNAENAIVPSIHSLRDLTFGQMPGYPRRQSAKKHTAALARVDTDNPLLGFLRRSTQNAHYSSQRIEAAARATGTANYPSFQLAWSFRTIAQLIRADVGIRIFFTELGGGGIGGFDNHANQLGNHCALLRQLSESVAAFIHDLKRDQLLAQVILMTFSEFGRTVKENGRRGTGHGAAAPVFLAGGRLKGGLIGPHPSLTDLDNGGLGFHTDFRRVYATLLDRWLGFESRTVLDEQFKPLDILDV